MNFSRTTVLRWLFSWALLCCLSQSLDAQYDAHFKRWGQYYFAWEDWRWWRAQGIVESHLDPNARSWAGAIGVMQLMPLTAKEVKVNPFDPEDNIRGGIQYDRKMWDRWKSVVYQTERRRFMFASYNAGPGNIGKAAALASGATNWEAVSKFLSAVTGKRSIETVEYVKRIERTHESGHD